MSPRDLAIMEGQPDPDGLWELMGRDHVEAALMFELDFADEPMLLSNRLIGFRDNLSDRFWGAGAGLMINVGDVENDINTLAPFREYALGATWDLIEDRSDWIAQINRFATNRANYWRRRFAMHIQFFEDGLPVHMPITRDVSLMDKMSVQFDPGGVVILLQVESMFGRMGVPGYGKLTQNHQRARHPTDEGLQFVTESDRLVVRTNF